MSTSRGAIILCGGASTRMGHDKALLPFGPDEVLLERVVRLVGKAVPETQIVCVAGVEQLLPPLPADMQLVRDARPYAGPLAAFATGMSALSNRCDVAFACGCDTPLLVPGFITRMFELLAGHQIGAPHDSERYHPLAAVYRTDVLPIAEALLAAGERSLTALVDRCDTLRVPMEELRDVDPDLVSLTNCNTPAELQRALAAAFPESVEP